MIISEKDRINNVVPESGITTRVFVFMLGHEQSLAAARTRIDTWILYPPILSCECSFSPLTLGDIELYG
jgi:hypothetical protein